MDTHKTPYSSVCDILGELWIEYKGDEAFVDFSNIPDDELLDRLMLIKNEVKK